jgi:hypothetical protein
MVLINWEDLGSIKNHKYYLNKQEKNDYININIVNKEKPLEEVKNEEIYNKPSTQTNKATRSESKKIK